MLVPTYEHAWRRTTARGGAGRANATPGAAPSTPRLGSEGWRLILLLLSLVGLISPAGPTLTARPPPCLLAGRGVLSNSDVGQDVFDLGPDVFALC